MLGTLVGRVGEVLGGKHTKKKDKEKESKEKEPLAAKTWTWRDVAKDIVIGIAFLFVGYIVGASALDPLDYLSVEFKRPCLESFGHVSAVWTVPYDPAGDIVYPDRLTADARNGSQFLYSQTLRNTGSRELLQLSVRLNLPGVPISTTSDGAGALVDASPQELRFAVRENPNTEPKTITRTYDPRVVAPPQLEPTTGRELGYPESSSNDSIDIWGSADKWSWTQTVVAANGTNTVTYHLPLLAPGSEWHIHTLYFGNRTAQEAGGIVSAAAATHGSVAFNDTRLDVFQAGDFTEPRVLDCDSYPGHFKHARPQIHRGE